MFAKIFIALLAMAAVSTNSGTAWAEEDDLVPADIVSTVKKARTDIENAATGPEAQAVLEQIEAASKKSRHVLLGTGDGQNPDSSTRLRVRYAKLGTKLIYLHALHFDLQAAQVIEDGTEELVGTGAVALLTKYSPGLAVVVPFGFYTVKYSAYLAKDVVTLPVHLFGRAIKNSTAMGGRMGALAAVPFKYVGGVITAAAVPVAFGALTSYAAYNMYSISMDKKDFEALLAGTKADIASTTSEIDAIDKELETRANSKP